MAAPFLRASYRRSRFFVDTSYGSITIVQLYVPASSVAVPSP